MRSAEEVMHLLRDLCTPAELEALTDRWRVVPFLLHGIPYREIHDKTGVSVTTIGRVARFLLMGAGGYRLAAKRLGIKPDDQSPSSKPKSGSIKRIATLVIASRKRSSTGRRQ